MHKRRRRRREARQRKINDLLSRRVPKIPILDSLRDKHIDADADVGGVCKEIDWDSLPKACDPAAGLRDQNRVTRKRQQLESMVKYVLPQLHALHVAAKNKKIAKALRVVEFGAGSGHLSILLAYLAEQQGIHGEFVLVERKEYSCKTAWERIEALPRSTKTLCTVFCGDITTFKDSFDLALSLHSCGLLSDACVALACRARASFILCPCCYGQIVASKDHPKSAGLSAVYSKEEFASISSTADFAVRAGQWNFGESAAFKLARSSMRLVDLGMSDFFASLLLTKFFFT